MTLQGQQFGFIPILAHYLQALTTSKKTLEIVIPEREQGKNRLQKWSKILRSFDDYEIKLEAIEREYGKFTTLSNLSLLLLLERNHEKKRHTANSIIKLTSSRKPTEREIANFINQFNSELVEKIGNRNYRIHK